ncbi:MAG: hypothetical protein J7621_23340 [Niastella sp.]|nr:hypothetical protein [Niastella sp.]
MARPNKAADKRRCERFELRLTINEAHELVTRAINAKMSISDYIRKSALGDHALEQQATPDHALMLQAVEELNRINTVLGQIVRSGRFTQDGQQLEQLAEALDTIKTLSGQLIKKISL